MIKIKAIYIFIALMCVASITQADNVKRVTDPASFFSIIPPEGWDVVRVHSNRESMIEGNLPGETAQFKIAAKPLPVGSNFKSFLDSFKEAMTKSLKNPKFGPYRICESEALAVVGQAVENNLSTIERIVFQNRGVAYVVTMVYPTREWKRYRAVLQEVLGSLNCQP